MNKRYLKQANWSKGYSVERSVKVNCGKGELSRFPVDFDDGSR
jgi:hypothetical protein